MSHHGNEILLEGHFEDGLDMSTEQLAKALDLSIDALGTWSFKDCEFDGDNNHKILFTGYEIYGHEELAEMNANQQFETMETGYA